MDFQMTPEMRLNPYPLYSMMRASQPILRIDQYQLFNVFRYDDVKTVLSDNARFSSSMGQMPGQPQSLITTDPPRHTQLRSLVTRAFTPRAIAALEPRIAALTQELLDQVSESGRIDLIGDLAGPLPVMVIAEMLGIPAADRARFKHWSDLIVESADDLLGEAGVDRGVYESAMNEMHEYFQHTIALRRAAPGQDLISGLLAADLDGERLSEQDLFNFFWLLLVAGNETTTNLLGNAILSLLEHPDQLERLQAQPELLSTAIEEVLRYRSPVQAMFRRTHEPVTLSGVEIPAGQRIIAWIGSANRDENRFAAADQFDVGRDPNPHIAFGHGSHFCLGAPLARLEARIALPLLLQRLPGLTRLDEAPLEPVTGFIVHGVKHLPLRFTPGRG